MKIEVMEPTIFKSSESTANTLESKDQANVAKTYKQAHIKAIAKVTFNIA